MTAQSSSSPFRLLGRALLLIVLLAWAWLSYVLLSVGLAYASSLSAGLITWLAWFAASVGFLVVLRQLVRRLRARSRRAAAWRSKAARVLEDA